MTSTADSRTADPRALRTRQALFAAAIRLVSDTGSSAVTVTAIANRAGVTRQAAYLHYRDQPALLLDAARDLAERELLPAVRRHQEEMHRRGITSAEMPPPLVDVIQHLHEHRDYYRPMFVGACAYALDQQFIDILSPFSARGSQGTGDSAGSETSQSEIDAATLVTGGAGTIMRAWLLDDTDTSTPHQLAARITAAVAALSQHLTGRTP